MEPSDLLNLPGDEPSPDPDVLRAIVERAGRRRWRSIGVGVAVAAVVGAGVGLATSRTSHTTQTHVASAGTPGTSTPSGHAALPSTAPLVGTNPSTASGEVGSGQVMIQAPTYKHEFTRTANGVTTRAYQVVYATGSPSVPSSMVCGTTAFGPELSAEVSTDAMVDTVGLSGSATQATADSVAGPDTSIVGTLENDPTEVVIARAGSAVAQVKLTTATGGTDQMAPIDGWVVLAVQLPVATNPVTTKDGQIEALSSSGAVQQTLSLDTGDVTGTHGISGTSGTASSSGGGVAEPSIACACPQAGLVTPNTPVASGSSSSSGAVSGSASGSSSSSSTFATCGPITVPPQSVPANRVLPPAGSSGGASGAPVPNGVSSSPATSTAAAG